MVPKVNISHVFSGMPKEYYIPGSAGVPSLSTDQVTTAVPLDAVLSTGLVGVGDVRATITPTGVVETVVVTGGVGSSGTLAEERGASLRLGDGSGDGADDGSDCEEDGGE